MKKEEEEMRMRMRRRDEDEEEEGGGGMRMRMSHDPASGSSGSTCSQGHKEGVSGPQGPLGEVAPGRGGPSARWPLGEVALPAELTRFQTSGAAAASTGDRVSERRSAL
ncbi:unnamed protein product [Pleuronectes platessa]|uniref:Uncharacterized protein n=1 Tax=Pleuronectes platessa TaxID=8262 RepID=A0A9N7YK84_PLEPL|nr:unnamed protein product [Pleuronectes platessa]